MAATRRRGKELEKAILETGWDQLMEQGYTRFTFEAVAERAKTGKAVLYRRWPTKASLLLAVINHHAGPPLDAPDTGSLREDTIILLRSVNRLGDSAASLFSIVLGTYFDGTETTPSALRTQLLGDRRLGMARIIDLAVGRGELSAAPSELVSTLPLDLLRHQLIMTLQPVPEATIVEIVDTAFLPLLDLKKPATT